MRRKFTLVVLSLFLSITYVMSQNCDPNSPPNVPAAGCACAFPDCNFGLDGFSATLGTLNTSQQFPGCTNNILNNDDWIAFIAGSTSISITINISNCQGTGTGGGTGVQAGFYGACSDPVVPTDEGTSSNPLSLQCGCTISPINLNYNNFIVGQTYYIVIDGCGGDICDYAITVNSGSTTVNPPGPLNGITGVTEVCPGQTETYTTNAVTGISNYNWMVSGGTVISENANTITIQWNTSGSISAFGENACYTTNTVNLNVNVTPLPPTSASGSYCESLGSYFYPANGMSYTAGNYTIIFPGASPQGCDETVNLSVTEHPEPFINMSRTICQGGQVVVGGIPYTNTGNYEISLTSYSGCDSTIFLDLTVLSPTVFVLNPQPLGCTTSSTFVDGTPSSGDIFEWSSPDGGFICAGDGTPLITACSPGTYCLTVTSFGVDQGVPIECSQSMCVQVTQDSNAPNLSITGTNVSCSNAANGTATVSVLNGGAPPFIYVWSSGDVGQTATGLNGGNYTVTVTGAGNGCTSEISIMLTEPPEIFTDLSSEEALCWGEMSGSATVIASGGAGGFQYAWSSTPPQNGPTATNLAAGTYTVTVTDANMCTAEDVIEVEQAEELLSDISGEDALCNGEASGSASIVVDGGTGPGTYSYEWNTVPVQSTETAQQLEAGDYQVTVTDENGCTVVETVTIDQPSELILELSSEDVSCSGVEDGSTDVVASGGTPPYDYLWDSTPNQATQSATGLGSGDYTVLVSDANGCTAQATVTVEEPAGLAVTSSATDASCNGGTDGEASVSASGGSGSYTYTWNTVPQQTGPTALGLSAGSYQVSIADGNSCEQVEVVVIAQPDAILISTSSTAVDCNGGNEGSASITVTGGTGAYSYLWSNGETGSTANNLTAGPYTVTVTDEQDCSAETTITITQPTALSLNGSGVNILCNAATTGEASVSASGGTGPYSYSWNTTPEQTTPTATALGAGTYTVQVTDFNGCTALETVNLTQPSALALSLNGSNPNCNTSGDGTAGSSVSGGTGPYSYSWNTIPEQTTPTANNLDGGTYTLVVTDSNGCTISQTIDLSVPNALSLTTSQVDILCNGENTGSATVTATGGTLPYSYSWNTVPAQPTATALNLGANSYTVVVTDGNNCSEQISVNLSEPAAALSASGTSTDATCGETNGTIDITVTGGTAPYSFDWGGSAGDEEDPSSLGPGSYTVVITDDNGCTTSTSVQVSTPSGLEALVSITNASCNGQTNGAVNITVNGGVAPYTYDWNIDNNDGNEDFTDVGAGTYTIIVTDSDGCSVQATGVVTQPQLLTATATASQASCGGADGSVSLVVSGGTAPYDYDWPGTANDGTQSPTGLSPGTYEVIVTDAQGCTVSASAAVTVPNGPETALTGTALSCFEDNTGSIDLTVTGGQGPYSYDWNGTDVTYDGQQDLTNLPAGIYEVVVTDVNACSSVSQITIAQPSILEVNTNSTSVSCNGGTDGTATATPAGGTGPYTYLWCDGQTTQTAQSCPAGPCVVIITDANGCTAEATTTVDEPAVLQASASTSDVDCNGASTGSVTVTASGGVGVYTYSWTPAVADPNALAAGNYEVMVTDDNGCTTLVSNITIDQPQALQITGITTQATCNQTNGTIDITVTGGSGAYSYNWTGLNGDEDQNAVGAGSYTVQVTDGNGCTVSADFTVDTPSALSVNSTDSNDALCNGDNSGSTSVTISGGSPPYTYQWDDGQQQTTQTATDLPAGTYMVQVTDSEGCVITATAVVNQPPALATSWTSTEATCGSSNGSIDLTVSGGTLPYSFNWPGTVTDEEDPSGISAGSYEVTVTDGNGCTITETAIINTPNALQAITSTTNALCNGEASGTISTTVTGGTAPFTYAWSNGLGSDPNPPAVAANNYTVIVTDADGCSVFASATVNEPTALQATSTSVEATCNEANGSINLTVSGGTLPYTYNWDNGSTAEDPQDLLTGNYMVVVTDANGCTLELSQAVSTPSALAITGTETDAVCNGEANGSINLTVSGGSAPYNYSWDNGGGNMEDPQNLAANTYTVQVTDGDGCMIAASFIIGQPPLLEVFDNAPSNAVSCNGGSDGGVALVVEGGTGPYSYDWSENSFDGILSPQNMWAGTFSLTVTDNQGCTATYAVTITEPDAIQLTTTSTATLCNNSSDGSIDLTVEGGTPPFSYDWNNGQITDQDPDNIQAGSYTVIVSDANNCTASTTATVSQPSALQISIENVSDYGIYNVTCPEASDGSAEAIGAGGASPYSYSWSNGTNTGLNDNLGPGTFTVTVTDANGCSNQAQVTLTAPQALEVSLLSVEPDCHGENNGQVIVQTVSGGTGPYMYSIDESAFSPVNQFTNLLAGAYQIAVQDVNGCEWTSQALVTEPVELMVDLGQDLEFQLGDSVRLEPVLNVPLFSLDTFLWRPVALTDFEPWVRPDQTTSYTLRVINERGCVAEDNIQVRVRKDRLIYIPNAFTPNNDGSNDIFYIYGGKGVEEVQTFRIFNRWGEVMYEAYNFLPMPHDPDMGWDGTFKGEVLNPAVFVYYAEIKFIDGRVEKYKGDVTLSK